MKNFSEKTLSAIRDYGFDHCVEAYRMHSEDGEGATACSTTGERCDGDRAIDAGREIAKCLHGKKEKSNSIKLRIYKKPNGNFGFKIYEGGSVIHDELSKSHPSREIAGSEGMRMAHFFALESGLDSFSLLVEDFQPLDSDYD